MCVPSRNSRNSALSSPCVNRWQQDHREPMCVQCARKSRRDPRRLPWRPVPSWRGRPVCASEDACAAHGVFRCSHRPPTGAWHARCFEAHMHLAPRAKLKTGALACALTLALACGGTSTASRPDVDAGSDAARCPTPMNDDPSAGKIGCGGITCDVGAAPICLVRTPYDGSCSSTECLPVPSECAGDLSCSCLMGIRTSESAADGGAGGDRFCGPGPGSSRHCAPQRGGIRVQCSGI